MEKSKLKGIEKDSYQYNQIPKRTGKSTEHSPWIDADRMITLTHKKAWSFIKQYSNIWASQLSEPTRWSKRLQQSYSSIYRYGKSRFDPNMSWNFSKRFPVYFNNYELSTTELFFIDSWRIITMSILRLKSQT